MTSKLMVFAAVVISTLQVSFALPPDTWSYERLREEADLVVVCTAVKSAPVLKQDEFHPKQLSMVKTLLNVQVALQGECREDQITLIHFRYREDSKGWENGPSVIKFVTTPGIGAGKSAIALGTQYLLFLKKRSDGDYETASGHFYPEPSVARLTRNWR